MLVAPDLEGEYATLPQPAQAVLGRSLLAGHVLHRLAAARDRAAVVPGESDQRVQQQVGGGRLGIRWARCGARGLSDLGHPDAAVESGAEHRRGERVHVRLSRDGRYRRSGGDSNAEEWESSAGVTTWEQAPAPAQVGRRLVEGLFGVTLPPTRARLVNNVMHWGYGILNGGQYGVVAESLPSPRIRYGLPFGAAIWTSGYVILPAAKLYEPLWKYDAKTSRMISAHISSTGWPRPPRYGC
jgi:hypothetical protein